VETAGSLVFWVMYSGFCVLGSGFWVLGSGFRKSEEPVALHITTDGDGDDHVVHDDDDGAVDKQLRPNPNQEQPLRRQVYSDCHGYKSHDKYIKLS